MTKTYAVDFGTSGMTASVYSDDYLKSKTLRNADGDEVVPTIFVDGPTFESHIYGKQAKEGQAVYQCITSAKTQFGRKEAYTKEGVKFDPEYVSSNLISHIVSELEESEGISIRNLVVTYPAYMKDLDFEVLHNYRKLFEENKKPGSTNREVRLMISEPEAAAMSNWHPGQEDQRMMVFDVGGGTTDACIVDFYTESGIHYVSTRNVYGEIIGGDDFDERFMAFFTKQMISQEIDYQKDIKLLKELHAKCEEIKINMSTRRDEEIEFYLFSNKNKKYVRFSINKKEYHKILMEFWEKIKQFLDRYTEMIDTVPIDKVLLVGGTCSNVILQKYLKEYFGKAPYQNVKVIAHKEKTAVAIGAANYAHWVLEEQQEIRLGVQNRQEPKVEVECSDSLGVKCVTTSGEYCIGNIIQKGSKFPCTSTRVFGIKDHGQRISRLPIPIYWNESENKVAKLEDGTLIGEIEIDLSGIQVEQGHKLEVMISMPSQGIVNVEGNYAGKIRVPGTLNFIRCNAG